MNASSTPPAPAPAPPSSGLDSQSKAHARKVRALLFLSFSWLLALLIGAGTDALLSLRQLDTVERQVSSRFSARSQALSTIVVSVRVYDDQLERFLLQDQLPAPGPTPSDVTKQFAQMRAALRNFPPDQFPEEQLLLAEMQSLLSDQENSVATVLGWRPGDRQQHAQQFIGEDLLPWRSHLLQISQQISTVDGKRLADENLALALRFQSMEERLVWLVALALLAGVLMSLVCGWYILRLERQGRQRYQALARSRLELESLSARLVEAQEEERRSISRELHDEVGQSLGALLVEAGQLSKLVSPEDRVTQAQIAHIKSVAESAVKSIRDIALLLRPPMLDDLGLVPALEWQAREISRRSDVEVEVHSQSVSEDLGDETKVTVYRLVQEALNNAATHASAKNAKVSVIQNEDKITVEITDDGDGFDPERKRGMGILGMEERVRRLGGSFAIKSSPGRGATVSAEIPLHPADSPVHQL
ncbi:MAG: sensor histidine kinase [Candidatus Acidiferrum sp.]